MKAGYDARERSRKEKEREREEREAEERREEEERDRDLEGWSDRLRKEHEAIMNKIKERGRRKAALSDRKSAAAQARMKSIANLAADERVPKRKRKVGGGELVSYSLVLNGNLTSVRGYVWCRRCGLGHLSQNRKLSVFA